MYLSSSTSVLNKYFIIDCCYWLCGFSPQTGTPPQKFHSIFPPSVKHFCLSIFQTLFVFFFKKKPRFKKFTLSGLESTSSASVNTPHKGDSFHGNKIVKKKKTWKHLLPTSFPGAPCTVVCKAWKLHLRQETLLSIGLAMNYDPTTNYLVYFPIN